MNILNFTNSIIFIILLLTSLIGCKSRTGSTVSTNSDLNRKEECNSVGTVDFSNSISNSYLSEHSEIESSIESFKVLVTQEYSRRNAIKTNLTVVFVENDFDHCGLSEDRTEILDDSLGCVGYFPGLYFAVTPFGLNNKESTINQLFSAAEESFSNSYAANNSCNETSLGLTAPVSALKKFFDGSSSTYVPPQIKARRASEFIRETKVSVEFIDPKIAARKRNAPDGQQESWLAFIDPKKVRANQAMLETLAKNPKSKIYKQLFICCLLDDARTFLESAITLRAGGGQPRAIFAGGMYGSGKTVSVKALQKELGDQFPDRINADVVKVYLKENVGGTAASNHVASSQAANMVLNGAIRQRASFVWEGAKISDQVESALRSGAYKNLDVDYRIISPQMSMLRVLKREVGGEDPNIPFSNVKAATAEQLDQLNKLIGLARNYPDGMNLAIWIPRRNSSGDLAVDGQYQPLEKVVLRKGMEPGERAAALEKIQKEADIIKKFQDELTDDATVVDVLKNRQFINEVESTSLLRSYENEFGASTTWGSRLTLKKALNDKAGGNLPNVN